MRVATGVIGVVRGTVVPTRTACTSTAVVSTRSTTAPSTTVMRCAVLRIIDSWVLWLISGGLQGRVKILELSSLVFFGV